MNLTTDEINSIAHAVSAKIEMRLETYIAGQNERCLAHRKQTEGVEHTLYGNGRPGIVVDVQNNRTIARVAVFVASGAFLAFLYAIANKLITT